MIRWASLMALTLAACGGGGGNSGICNASIETCTASPSAPPVAEAPSPSPAPGASPAPAPAPSEQPASSPEGFWTGSGSNGRTGVTIVQDDGTFWSVYSVAGNPNVVAGAAQGHLQRLGENFVASDVLDVNFEGLGVSRGSLAGSFVAQSTITGSIQYSRTTVTFTGVFEPAYLKKPSTASLAGRYVSQATIANSREIVTVDVSGNGTMTGSGTSGCTFSGTAAPRASGNVFATKITFNGTPCLFGRQTLDGVLYYDETVNRAYGASLTSARDGGFMFVAPRQ